MAHTSWAMESRADSWLASPDAGHTDKGEIHRVEQFQPTSFAKTGQAISARVLAESRRSYGSLVDEATLDAWVSVTLASLLTERTRVTTFVPVLAMRDIRTLVEQHQRSESAT